MGKKLEEEVVKDLGEILSEEEIEIFGQWGFDYGKPYSSRKEYVDEDYHKF